jgi:hypothetical protein
VSKIVSAAAASVVVVAVIGVIALTTFDHPASPKSDEAAVLGFTLVRNEDNNGNAKGLLKKQVVATGEVNGLHPGAVRNLVVTLRNDNNFWVDVTDIVVGVRSSTPGCNATVVRVDEFHGSRWVDANSSATQTLVARTHNDAPDSCKNSSFSLAFTGTAVKP